MGIISYHRGSGRTGKQDVNEAAASSGIARQRRPQHSPFWPWLLLCAFLLIAGLTLVTPNISAGVPDPNAPRYVADRVRGSQGQGLSESADLTGEGSGASSTANDQKARETYGLRYATVRLTESASLLFVGASLLSMAALIRRRLVRREE